MYNTKYIFQATIISAVLTVTDISGMENTKEEDIKCQIKQTLISHMNPLHPVYNEGNIIKTKSHAPILKSYRQIASTITLKATPVRELGGDNKGKSNVLQIPDNRSLVESTNTWPHSAHGLVKTKFEDLPSQEFWGTGTLISPYLVLTAGHVLYNGKEALEVFFIPAMNGDQTPFGVIKAKKWNIPLGYKNTYNPHGDPSNEIDDYALLVLERPVGEEAGYFGLQIAPSDHLCKLRINITGYPSDKQKPQQYYMWQMNGTIEGIDGNHINHKIFTANGNSGGGGWHQEENECFVTCVHNFYDPEKKVGKATVITKLRYEQLKRWAEESILDRIREGMQAFEGIVSLNLSNKFIEDFGVHKLFEYGLPYLQIMDLSGNKISNNGAREISRWLAKSIMIVELNLNNNQIGFKGVRDIGKVMAANTTLTKLDLSNNDIEDQGAESLGISLTKNTTLMSLDLRWNMISSVEDKISREKLFPTYTMLKIFLVPQKVIHTSEKATETRRDVLSTNLETAYRGPLGSTQMAYNFQNKNSNQDPVNIRLPRYQPGKNPWYNPDVK